MKSPRWTLWSGSAGMADLTSKLGLISFQLCREVLPEAIGRLRWVVASGGMQVVEHELLRIAGRAAFGREALLRVAATDSLLGDLLVLDDTRLLGDSAAREHREGQSERGESLGAAANSGAPGFGTFADERAR
jgi:hypothetical protein